MTLKEHITGKRSVHWAMASMAISGIVLLGGFLFGVLLLPLIAYMLIATTFVLLALRWNWREYRRSILVGTSECPVESGTRMSDRDPYRPPAEIDDDRPKPPPLLAEPMAVPAVSMFAAAIVAAGIFALMAWVFGG